MHDVSTITVRRPDPAGDEDVVFVRGFRALKGALNDWRTFSSDTHGFLVLTPQDKTRTFRQYPFEFDPPTHTAYRALIEPFYKRALQPEYAARIQALIRRRVDVMLAAPQVSVIDEFSLPLQNKALTVLLEMPESEAEVWMRFGTDVFRSGSADALVDYLEMQTDKADREDSDSIFGVLKRAEYDGRPLTRDERLGFAHITFSGGRDTVINMLTGIVALFAVAPDMLDAIRRNPGLIPSATEELLRFISPLGILTRVCPHGGAVDGVEVLPDQRIALCYARANRDPAVFDQPDTFIIDRKPNPHLAFGSGPHSCLGNAHARLLARTLMNEFATRVGRFEVCEAVPDTYAAPFTVDGLRYERLVVRAHAVE
ncbi:MAG: cytochrome P450 [Chloroflexota bacterium]|jgi:cytochrome P450